MWISSQAWLYNFEDKRDELSIELQQRSNAVLINLFGNKIWLTDLTFFFSVCYVAGHALICHNRVSKKKNDFAIKVKKKSGEGLRDPALNPQEWFGNTTKNIHLSTDICPLGTPPSGTTTTIRLQRRQQNKIYWNLLCISCPCRRHLVGRAWPVFRLLHVDVRIRAYWAPWLDKLDRDRI